MQTLQGQPRRLACCCCQHPHPALEDSLLEATQEEDLSHVYARKCCARTAHRAHTGYKGAANLLLCLYPQVTPTLGGARLPDAQDPQQLFHRATSSAKLRLKATLAP
jgi:hypothetical protein